MDLDLEKLKEAALAATKGPWQWWTSNSVLRLSGADGRDGGVISATMHANWPDIACSQENQAHIAAFNPAVALELIAEIERLRSPAASGAKLEGYVLVPKEPTKEMLECGMIGLGPCTEASPPELSDFADCYTAMIAAAPLPPEPNAGNDRLEQSGTSHDFGY